MPKAKYVLRGEGESCAVGKSNLRGSRGGAIDTDGCLVLWVVSGCAVATINFKRCALRRGDFVVLFYDSTFAVEGLSSCFSVCYVSLAYSLVEEAVYQPLSSCFWDVLYACPVLHPSFHQQELLSGWWRQLEWICGLGDVSLREEMLKNSIRNMLLATDVCVGTEKSLLPRNGNSHAWMLVTRFFKLLSVHAREVRDVRFYADRLSVTPTYLYKVCREYVQDSPKGLIDKQVITEIKTCLAHTDMPVKSIAAELHFDDVSYMCRYFRRQTGQSPQEFRRGQK